MTLAKVLKFIHHSVLGLIFLSPLLILLFVIVFMAILKSNSPTWDVIAQYQAPGEKTCAVVVERGAFLSRSLYEIYLYSHTDEACREGWVAGRYDRRIAAFHYPFPEVAWVGKSELIYVGSEDPEVTEWFPGRALRTTVTIERVEKIE